MRIRLVVAFVLAAVVRPGLVPAQAQTQLGVPAQAFAFFRCTCNTSVGQPLPNQLSFAPPPVRVWNGSVYAATDRDAISRAQNSCTSERRGSLFDCINCRCTR